MDGTARGQEMRYLQWRIRDLENELSHANQLNSGLQQQLEFTKTLFRTWQHDLNRSVGRAGLENRKRKDWIEALQQSEERYRTLYNNSPLMAWSTDPQGQLVSASNSLLKALGFSRGEVIGLRPEDFLGESCRSGHGDKLCPLTGQAGLTSDIPLQLLCKDGELLDIMLSVVIEKTPDGKPLGSMAAMVDITARKRAEEALKHYARQLADVLGALPETIRLRDLQHRVIFTNLAPEVELEAAPCFASQGRTSPCPDCPAAHTLASGEPGRIERPLADSDSWQEVATYPICDESGKITHIVEHIRDIKPNLKATFPQH